MSPKASEIVVEIAKRFIEFALSAPISWDEAFLRFSRELTSQSVTSIYRKGTESSFFSSHGNAVFEMYERVGNDFMKLRALVKDEVGKDFYVALLRVSRDLDYKIFFEYQDGNRWYITKENGASGIPVID